MPIDLSELDVKKQPRNHGGVRIRYYRKTDGREVCGAKLRCKPENVRCAKDRQLSHAGRCRYHGGAKGSGAPVTVDRWGNAAGRLADSYRSALHDPALLDISRPLAILDTQVVAALKLAEEHDCPAFRKRALDAYKDISAARSEGDEAAVQEAFTELGVILKEGAKEQELQYHAVCVTERFMKRLEKTWEIRLSRSNAVNAQDLTSILGRLVDAVQLAAPPDVAKRVLYSLDKEFRDIAGVLEPREVEAEVKTKAKEAAR